jgi:hypothetical protein
LKKIIFLFVFTAQGMAGVCQQTNSDVGAYNTNLLSLPQLNFAYNPTAASSIGSYSGHSRGHSMNSDAVLNMLSNKFNINVPTKYRYKVKGVDFQAGLLTNSRQPKLGAGLSSPSGFSFSAGYGVGINSFNRVGYSPINAKSSGIQFTAGYRLFGKRK